MPKVITEYSETELSEIITGAVEKVFLKWNPNKHEIKQQTHYLTRREAAKRLNVSEVTLSTYTKEGKVQGYILGGKMLYLESDLDAALVSVEPLKYRRG
jgi:excisionase family DNA binding protein